MSSLNMRKIEKKIMKHKNSNKNENEHKKRYKNTKLLPPIQYQRTEKTL